MRNLQSTCFECAAEQIQAALRGKVLLDVRLPKQWERNAELEFGPRLGEPSHRLFLEIMGKCVSVFHPCQQSIAPFVAHGKRTAAVSIQPKLPAAIHPMS